MQARRMFTGINVSAGSRLNQDDVRDKSEQCV